MSFNNPFENFFKEKKTIIKSQGSSVREQSEGIVFEAGEYIVRMKFKNRKGEEVVHETGFPMRFTEPMSIPEVEKKAAGDVAFTGPHNLGMDIYVERYPNGHPVTIEILKKGESNPVHTFVRVFNANGHVVSHES